MERNEVERHAPQGRARTMSDEQEAICRAGTNPIWVRDLIAELDAERAAHEVTKARLALAEALEAAAANFLSPSRMGCTLEELRAGVVELAHTQPDARAAADTLALIDALAAWRAAK